jgi:hypothetical protein
LSSQDRANLSVLYTKFMGRFSVSGLSVPKKTQAALTGFDEILAVRGDLLAAYRQRLQNR